jgi:hypothetical protein
MPTRTPTRKPGPVTVGLLPVTRCSQCGHPVVYKPEPGAAQAALTAHYQKAAHGPR